MANVKISDMTAKTGALDGDELLEIVSDPSGTPATRRITTTQVSNIALVSLDSMALGFSVDSVVSAVPGSPSEGDKHLVLDSGDAYEDEVIWYRNGAWVEYTPVHLNQITDLATGYIYRFYIDTWLKKIDYVLYGTTTDGAGTGDSTTLTYNGTNYPTLVDTEFWDVDHMMVSAACDDGDQPMVSSGISSGAWEFKGHIAAGVSGGSPSSAPQINDYHYGIFPYNMTAVYSPDVSYTTPTIAVNASLQLVVTVEHTSTASSTVNWKGYISGWSRTGVGSIIPPA